MQLSPKTTANNSILGPLPPYESPTLRKLPENQRPNPSTVCERCPASVWFSSTVAVKCFCRVMHLITWSPQEPNAMTECDGEVMAREAREHAAENP
jgi:hypothetical protein